MQIEDESAIPVQAEQVEQVQEAATPAEPAAAEPAEVATPEPAVEASESARTPDWVQKRIDQITREKHEERRKREAAEQLVAQYLKGDAQPQAPSQAQEDPHDIARKLVAEERFNDACNRVYQSGKGEFQDFDASLAQFQQLGGLPNDFLQAVVDLPDSHKLIYALSKDLGEAYRIFSLPAIQQGRELERLSAKVSKPASKPVSSAPAPIAPVDGPANADPDPSKMSVDEWMRWRNANLANKR